jgi:hypothetical protein
VLAAVLVDKCSNMHIAGAAAAGECCYVCSGLLLWPGVVSNTRLLMIRRDVY